MQWEVHGAWPADCTPRWGLCERRTLRRKAIGQSGRVEGQGEDTLDLAELMLQSEFLIRQQKERR